VHLSAFYLNFLLQVHTALRLTALLHKKISSDLLPLRNLPFGALDKFASLSPTLLSASDELIASLFSPQDVSHIRQELDSFTHIIYDVKEAVGLILGDKSSEKVEEAMENLALNGQALGKNKLRKRWFDGCFEQITRALEKAAVILNANTQS